MNNKELILPEMQMRNQMTLAAKTKLSSMGYKLKKIPGRGQSNKWLYSKAGKTGKMAIKHSRDRRFAFENLSPGWKTLDEVDLIVVVSVDDKELPKRLEVYLFDANEVRDCFNKNREARLAASMKVNNYPMWISLDMKPDDRPNNVGSGLAAKYPAIEVVNIVYPNTPTPDPVNPSQGAKQIKTKSVADVIDGAKTEIATITSIPIEQITIELKFGY